MVAALRSLITIKIFQEPEPYQLTAGQYSYFNLAPTCDRIKMSICESENLRRRHSNICFFYSPYCAFSYLNRDTRLSEILFQYGVKSPHININHFLMDTRLRFGKVYSAFTLHLLYHSLMNSIAKF
jgi:hypothetical protein